MKKQTYQKVFSFVIVSILFVLQSGRVYAIPAGYQQCVAGDTCVVGEFVYDDSYVPVSNATCTLKSRYPDGSIFVNTQALTPGNDGWYGYDIVATGSAGLYKSQVCCTSSGELMCLDKSFEVVSATSSGSTLTTTDVANAVWDASRASHTTSGSFGEALQSIIPSSSDIATAVWGYSGRTLSSFGTLVSDIWSSSTRSLTTLGTLAADVWSSATRTLTGSELASGSIATKSDVDSVRSDVSSIIATTSGGLTLNNDKLDKIARLSQENRLLLEQVVNKPIIQNFLEEETTPDLQGKLDQTKTIATQLYTATSRVGGKLGLVNQKWSQMSSKDMLAAFSDFTKYMGDGKSTSNETVMGSLLTLRKVWDMAIIDEMAQQAEAFGMRLQSMQSEVRLYGKSTVAYEDLQQLRYYLADIDTKLGSAADTAGNATFFGHIRKITELAAVYDKQTEGIDKLLANWTSYKQDVITEKAQVFVDAITKINAIPQVMASLQIENVQTNKQLKNKVLGIRGVIDSNRKLLARSSEKPLTNIWLEEGSIVFKSLVTNPSKLISQTVPLKYYLPLEVTKESIISVDEGLTVAYDTEKNQFFVSAEFTLSPEESRTISVTVDEQVFSISDAIVTSLRAQAEELAKPLKNTSFFAQGVTLKSDIDVSLDKITQLQKAPVTPEARIRAYREANIELNAVKNKMEKLKELVTQVSSTGSLVGFVGGAQALAVWGIIIILIAGFVFLVLYMRVLRVHDIASIAPLSDDAQKKVSKTVKKNVSTQELPVPEQVYRKVKIQRAIRFAVVLLMVSSSTSILSGILVYQMTAQSQKGEQVSTVRAKADTLVQENTVRDVLGLQTEATKAGELVFSSLSASASATQRLQMVIVKDNPAGFLRVRKTPGGAELTRIDLGLQLSLIQKGKEWSQVKLTDGSLGWVATKLIEEKTVEEL